MVLSHSTLFRCRYGVRVYFHVIIRSPRPKITRFDSFFVFSARGKEQKKESLWIDNALNRKCHAWWDQHPYQKSWSKGIPEKTLYSSWSGSEKKGVCNKNKRPKSIELHAYPSLSPALYWLTLFLTIYTWDTTHDTTPLWILGKWKNLYQQKGDGLPWFLKANLTLSTAGRNLVTLNTTSPFLQMPSLQPSAAEKRPGRWKACGR